MLQPNYWQPVPGAAAQIYPYFRTRDFFSSNAFLISTAAKLLVIDPGSAPDQAAELEQVLRRELAVRPRPVLVVLTHCHGDHCASLCSADRAPFLDGNLTIIAAQPGIQALATADARLTQAELLGFNLVPAAYPAERLIALEDAGLPATDANATSLDLGEGDFLEIYPTPGHSPDHLCLRLGNLLLLGDLPFACKPLVAGIVGWDAAALLRSVTLATGLLQNPEISCCLPGHGTAVMPDIARQLLADVARQAGHIPAALCFDSSQARTLSAVGVDLLEAIQGLFTVIGGRLAKLDYALELLDEPRNDQSDGPAQIIRVEQLLAEFSHAAHKYAHGQLNVIALLQQTLYTVHKIQTGYDHAAVAELVDPLLPRLTLRLLTDFTRLARGLAVGETFAPVDLTELLASLLRCLEGTDAQAQALASVDDATTFATVLRRNFASGPIATPGQIRVPTLIDLAPAWLAPAGFADILLVFLQVLTVANPAAIDITATMAGDQLALVIAAGHAPSDSMLRACKCIFALYGATLQHQLDAHGFQATLYCTRSA